MKLHISFIALSVLTKVPAQYHWLNPLLIGQFENDIANIAKKPHIFAKQGTTDGDVLNRLLGGESALTISS